jgi:hypothetical protein
VSKVKNCKLCKLHRLCNDIPAFCFVLHYLALILVIGSLSFFFFRGSSTPDASANSPVPAAVQAPAPADSR